MTLNRREFVKTASVATLVGVTGLSGCIGSGGDDDSGSCTKVDNEPSYKGWFNGVSNYKATCDFRDQDEVTVKVGTKGNFDYYKYSPPAIAISPGTSVTWEWTGRGGPHNVVAEKGAFNSGSPVQSSTETFEHTFDSPGIYRYFCTPHRDLGMRGAVFVALG